MDEFFHRGGSNPFEGDFDETNFGWLDYEAASSPENTIQLDFGVSSASDRAWTNAYMDEVHEEGFLDGRMGFFEHSIHFHLLIYEEDDEYSVNDYRSISDVNSDSEWETVSESETEPGPRSKSSESL